MKAALARIRFTELQLLVVPSIMTVVGLLTIFLASTRDLNWDWRDIWVSLAYMAAVFAISIWFSITGFKGDQVLFPIVVCLSGLGLLMMQRLTPSLVEIDDSYAGLARQQLIYLGMGLALLAGVVTFVRNIGWLRRYKYTWAFGGLGLMLLTMVIGTERYGARLWLEIGPFTIQTSEITKIAMVVFLAAYLAENQELIVSTYRVGPLRLPPIPYLMPMVLMWGFSMLVVVAQNDLGTALLFFGVFLAMLYMASGRLTYVIAGLAAFAVGVYVAYNMFGRVQLRLRTGSIHGVIRSMLATSRFRANMLWRLEGYLAPVWPRGIQPSSPQCTRTISSLQSARSSVCSEPSLSCCFACCWCSAASRSLCARATASAAFSLLG